MRMRMSLLAPLVVVALAATAYGMGLYRDAHPQDEITLLFDLLDVGTGAVVAEIGAGEGYMMTIASARLLGPSGQVYRNGTR